MEIIIKNHQDTIQFCKNALIEGNFKGCRILLEMLERNLERLNETNNNSKPTAYQHV